MGRGPTQHPPGGPAVEVEDLAGATADHRADPQGQLITQGVVEETLEARLGHGTAPTPTRSSTSPSAWMIASGRASPGSAPGRGPSHAVCIPSAAGPTTS